MRTIVPFPARLVGDLEVGLVHEPGRLERSTARPPGELPVGDRAQLLVQERDEPVERLATAAPQLGYDCRGLRRGAHLLRERLGPVARTLGRARCRVSARFVVYPGEGRTSPAPWRPR